MSEFVSSAKNRGTMNGLGGPVKKLVLNQFGAAIFGIMLSSATMQSKMLNLVTSLFAIFFYLFLQYTAIWEIGAKDRIRVDGGRAAENKNLGLKIALYANLPNLILAALIFLFTAVGVLSQWMWAGSASLIVTVTARFWQGMYNGLIIYLIPGNLSATGTVLSTLVYAVIAAPSLLTNFVGYRRGYDGRRIFSARKDAEENK